MGESEGLAPARAALPKYVRITELLIREIAADRLSEGTRLPPERDMAANLGISVGTLRKALAELQTRGLLERRQGSGNYVRRQREVASVYAFFRLERLGGGGLPTAALLARTRMPKPADAPPFGPSPDAVRIRRLRRLDGEPVAVEEIWLDAAAAGGLDAAALSESLYLTWKQVLGLVIGRVEDRIGLGHAPDWAPAAFAPGPGALVALVERLGWAEGDTPVEFSRTWFDATQARYVSRMGRG
jgi:GntR family transcriptional regulator